MDQTCDPAGYWIPRSYHGACGKSLTTYRALGRVPRQTSAELSALRYAGLVVKLVDDVQDAQVSREAGRRERPR